MTHTDLTAEKALAILLNHPYLTQHGLLVSPYTPISQSPYGALPPNILPPSHNVPARYINPTILVSPILPAGDNASARMAAQLPTPGEVFDFCRRWAAVREVHVWMREGHPNNSQLFMWSARVEFWYEDEALRFDSGVGDRGDLLKGWQV